MTPVNKTIDQSHRPSYSKTRTARPSRLALAAAGAGLVVALTGLGVGAFMAGAASQHGSELYDNVVGNVGHQLAPNSQVIPELHGQQVDDWPWSTQASPVAN
jgi:hypothetical protein